MKIHGLVCCVDYSEFLEVGIERWLDGLSSLVVVTDLKDGQTPDLVRRHSRQNSKLTLFRTDAFTREGAVFNKGAALELGRQYMPREDWTLFLDADVVPPCDWRQEVERASPQSGNLYGCQRYQCDDPKRVDTPDLPLIRGDGIGVGFFQLFHSTDPVVQRSPLLNTRYLHAGAYDSDFLHLWPNDRRINLPIRLAHLGERDNWWGKGNKTAFAEMIAERERRSGRYDHETIDFKEGM